MDLLLVYLFGWVWVLLRDSLIDFVIGLPLLTLLSLMLLDEYVLVLVKVLENVLVVKQVFVILWRLFTLLLLIGDAINLVKVSSCPLFDIV